MTINREDSSWQRKQEVESDQTRVMSGVFKEGIVKYRGLREKKVVDDDECSNRAMAFKRVQGCWLFLGVRLRAIGEFR